MFSAGVLVDVSKPAYGPGATSQSPTQHIDIAPIVGRAVRKAAAMISFVIDVVSGGGSRN